MFETNFCALSIFLSVCIHLNPWCKEFGQSIQLLEKVMQMADMDLFTAQQCLMNAWLNPSQLQECMKIALERPGQPLHEILLQKRLLSAQQVLAIQKLWEPKPTTLSCPACSEKNQIRDYQEQQIYFCSKCGNILPPAGDLQKNKPKKKSVGLKKISRPVTTTLGNYTILAELGRGGMGVVYQVKHPELDFPLALKLLLPSQDETDQEENTMRFFREIELASQLHHPNIVGIHEVGSYNGCPYYTMDYIEGQTLDKILENRQPFPEKKALEIIEKIALGVGCAHRAQIVHRDIKPANILLDKHQRPFLMDFGIATCRDQAFKKLTRTGTIMGTPDYMSPEQASGKIRLISYPSDVYSLAATLYHLLTGVPPFEEASPMDTINKVLEGKITPPRQIVKTVSLATQAVVLKAMSFAIEDRYPNANIFAMEIRSLLSGNKTIAQDTSPWHPYIAWMKRNFIALLCFFITGLAIGITLFFISKAF